MKENPYGADELFIGFLHHFEKGIFAIPAVDLFCFDGTQAVKVLDMGEYDGMVLYADGKLEVTRAESHDAVDAGLGMTLLYQMNSEGKGLEQLLAYERSAETREYYNDEETLTSEEFLNKLGTFTNRRSDMHEWDWQTLAGAERAPVNWDELIGTAGEPVAEEDWEPSLSEYLGDYRNGYFEINFYFDENHEQFSITVKSEPYGGVYVCTLLPQEYLIRGSSLYCVCHEIGHKLTGINVFTLHRDVTLDVNLEEMSFMNGTYIPDDSSVF